MQISSKEPLVINLDAKDTTKNKEKNIIEMYKGGFRYTLEQTARYFSERYNCLAIFGADEISFIFEQPMQLVNDLNSDNNTFSTEIISVFSQYFFDYFNSINKEEKVFWHGKCFSIHNEKIISFLKYKSRLLQLLNTTYFLKHKGVLNAGKLKLEQKLELCNSYPEYNSQKDYQKGTLYYCGKCIDLDKYLENKICQIEASNCNNSYTDIEFDESMFDNIL